MKVSARELEEAVGAALAHYGYSTDEAKIIAGVLLFAQLRGNNQGVVKLIGAGIPRATVRGPIEIERETPSSALVNGNRHHAMIVLDRVTDLAIEKAKDSGIAICGNYGSSESTGALGYYVDRIARAGLIGIAFASAPLRTTAPYGGSEPLFCTNPVAWGIPTSGEPIVLDFSTSAIAYFGLIEADVAGRSLPEGLGFNSEGHPTRDASEMMKGAIKAMADHKGSGLALIVQILAGPLVGGGYFGKQVGNAGNLVIAFSPSLLTDDSDFFEKLDDMRGMIKESRKMEGVSEVLLPGERGSRRSSRALAEGTVEIEDGLWAALKLVGE